SDRGGQGNGEVAPALCHGQAAHAPGTGSAAMTARDPSPLDQDERALAQRLSRLDAQWAPSGALDARILAAAREAVSGTAGATGAIDATGAAPPSVRPRRRPRWPVGMGIAASLAVAVGVAWQLRPQPDTHVLAAPEAGPAVSAVAAPAARTAADMDPA